MAGKFPSIIDYDDKADNRAPAIFTNQIKLISAYIDKATNISHESKKAILDLATQVAPHIVAVKQILEAEESSGLRSKKQRLY